ncbi:phosphopantetheine-binding protein, partial [Maribacter sp. 2-571]|uniref:phosphopantetheine-binding protein n=1 Tax=Maribacter sp. 2-571 TaxID=3417569 RepID=UPI003D354FB6
MRECSVSAHADGNGNKRLVGYVVIDGDFDKVALQEGLKDSLPEYMVPQLWVSLDALPLTVNGKVDRKALPLPELSEQSTVEYVAPRNDVEQQLVAIWQELLGVEKVGVYDDFFELGGHSLLATRFVSMVRTRMEVEL